MKKIVTILLSLILVAPLYAQESKKDQKKAGKEAKKEEKAKQEAEANAIIKTSLEARQFVLEANFLADNKGQRITVEPILNFIGVDRDKGAFQFGNGKDVGYNGIGGMTVEGSVEDFELKESKKGSFTVTFRIVSPVGNVFVTLIVSSGGNGDATIRGSTAARLKYTGTVVPLGASRVYKGIRTL